MRNGKLISLYLFNGDPNGIVFSFLSNWTGQAIKVPRNYLEEVKERIEVNKPGIYFLFSKKEDENQIYIGESENVYKRLLQHIKNEEKDFFDEVVIFTSKDDDLTKGHIKYLEYRLINEVSNNLKFDLKNKNSTGCPSLPEMYKVVLEEYIKNIKILLPTLGYSIFLEKSSTRDKTLTFNGSGLKGSGLLAKNGKIIVLKGSQIKKENQKSLSNGYKALKERLIDIGVIDLNKCEFIKDYEFNSPSTAAAIMIGTAVNGKKYWISKDGKTLETIEKEEKDKLLKDFDK